MPKELTHFMIARAAGRQLDAAAAPAVTQAIVARPEAFLLGAVAHDGPYYLPKYSRMATLGARLHGKGVSDAFTPVRRAIAADGGVTALAFAAGALCHVAADTVFHPAVFYFTGFASHPDPAIARRSIFRHRAFETALDLHLWPEHGGGIERKVKRLRKLALARPDGPELPQAMGRFYDAYDPYVGAKRADLICRRQGETQRLFFSSPARWLARLLAMRAAGTEADLTTLFYRPSSRWAGFFASPRPYCDPVTGATGSFEARAFFGRAVERAVSFLGMLERARAGLGDPFPFPGPNLESGHPVDDGRAMRYCEVAVDDDGLPKVE